jgi:hypothetical protein
VRQQLLASWKADLGDVVAHKRQGVSFHRVLKGCFGGAVVLELSSKHPCFFHHSCWVQGIDQLETASYDVLTATLYDPAMQQWSTQKEERSIGENS